MKTSIKIFILIQKTKKLWIFINYLRFESIKIKKILIFGVIISHGMDMQMKIQSFIIEKNELIEKGRFFCLRGTGEMTIDLDIHQKYMLVVL